MIDFLIVMLAIQYAVGWLYYAVTLQEISNRSQLITVTVFLVLGGVIGGLIYVVHRDFKKAWNNK